MLGIKKKVSAKFRSSLRLLFLHYVIFQPAFQYRSPPLPVFCVFGTAPGRVARRPIRNTIFDNNRTFKRSVTHNDASSFSVVERL